MNPRDEELLKPAPEVEGYRVLEPCVLYSTLGRGGMGAVFLGLHWDLNVKVAVKCMLGEFGKADGALVLRLRREAEILASLHHQNLVGVYDLKYLFGIHYIVMEYVQGESAAARVQRTGPLEMGEAVQITLGATRGLERAHRKGIFHRDIKPANILISTEGEVKLADLGLGKMQSVGDGQEGMTGSQQVWGTPGYMPPEQWEGLSKAAAPGDIWAMGATLYHLLVGEKAIAGGVQSEVMRRTCLEPFPDIRDRLPALPPDLANVVRKSTEIDRQNRFSSASEMITALEEVVRAHSLTGSHGETTVPGSGDEATQVVSPSREIVDRIRDEYTTRISVTPPPGPTSREKVVGLLRKRWRLLATLFLATAALVYFIWPPPPINLTVTLDPNRSLFAEGDRVDLIVEADQVCHVTVFLTEDSGSAFLVSPGANEERSLLLERSSAEQIGGEISGIPLGAPQGPKSFVAIATGSPLEVEGVQLAFDSASPLLPLRDGLSTKLHDREGTVRNTLLEMLERPDGRVPVEQLPLDVGPRIIALAFDFEGGTNRFAPKEAFKLLVKAGDKCFVNVVLIIGEQGELLGSRELTRDTQVGIPEGGLFIAEEASQLYAIATRSPLTMKTQGGTADEENSHLPDGLKTEVQLEGSDSWKSLQELLQELDRNPSKGVVKLLTLVVDS